MTGYTQSYERKSTSFRSLARTSAEFNPTKVEYYTSSDELVRVEETWRGQLYAQTISGSGYAQHWPNYSYTVTYDPWTEAATSSGVSSTSSGVNHVFITYP